ncbi:DNA-processing protein DprA [Nocardia brasiliensis]|uniref:DNA-processing protein DprA n=1 Tax=Nocardia brasiliensis TaxID=37326 RepID=UPI003D8A0A06
METAVASPDLVPISDARRLAWAVLSRAACGPSHGLWRLVDELGVEDAAAAVEAGDVAVAVAADVLERGDRELAARDLQALIDSGGRLVTPEDQEWPAARLSTLHSCPFTDARAGVAPLALWVRGSASLSTIARAPVAAILGHRSATGYGDCVVNDFVENFAARGWAICSSAEQGAASRAHRTALACQAPTIAVLACGIDRVYLHRDQDLTERIAAGGLLVTEYPPHTPLRPTRANDAARLVAALSDIAVAVEAQVGDLTCRTVRWAGWLGAQTYAVPGPVTSAASTGCHELISTGRANLAADACSIAQPQHWADHRDRSVAS